MACGKHPGDTPDIADDFEPADASAEHDDPIPLHEAFLGLALDRIAAEPRGML